MAPTTAKTWAAAFMMGVCVFAPLQAFMTCVDYYDEIFPAKQAAVVLSAIYDATFTLSQLLCYFNEKRFRAFSSKRIIGRHLLVAALLALVVMFDQVVVGSVVPAPDYALWVLEAFAVFIGLSDGVSVGAVFGEAGIIGGHAAHAVVAGTGSSFLLLIGMRCITKAALTEDLAGTRVSFCIYFGVCAGLLLVTLLVYLMVVRPAVTTAIESNSAAESAHMQANGVLHKAKSLAAALSKKPSSPAPVNGSCDLNDLKHDVNDQIRSCFAITVVKATEDVHSSSSSSSSVDDDDRSSTSGSVVGDARRREVAETSAFATPAAQLSSQKLTRPLNLKKGVSMCIDIEAGSFCDDIKYVPPKYATPGCNMLRMTLAILRDQWSYALGALMAYVLAYAVFPAYLSYVKWDKLESWYPLVLQVFFGVGDLVGKCLPLMHPRRPHMTFTFISLVRLAFIPAFVLALWYQAGPAVFMVLTLLLSLSGWYESSVFAMACEGLHHDDAFQVESLLAIMVQFGSLLGACFSLLLKLGPWVTAA